MNKFTKLLLAILACTLMLNFSSIYFVGLDRKTMNTFLKKQKYPELQADIYAKYEAKNPEDQFLSQWIHEHNSQNYDILLLYFVIRESYYHTIAPNVALQFNQIKEAYKVSILFFIRMFQDVCACVEVDPKYKDPTHQTYEFLRSKITNLWLSEIFKYNVDFKEVMKEIRSKLQKDSLIPQLPSPAWACCSSTSSLRCLGLKPNTFYFGEPNDDMQTEFADKKEIIDKARSEALSKILSVLGQLEDQNGLGAEKFSKFANTKLETLLSGGID